MRQKVMQNLKGDAIEARDGRIGSVEDVYFDDAHWAVRYLVVDTGEAHARYYGYPQAGRMPPEYREMQQTAENRARVEDFIVDDKTWAIADMVGDTRNWLPGKKVLVPPSAISDIDWNRGEVSVKLKREELKRAPESH